MAASAEYMECTHHKICNRAEGFSGCGQKCKDFEYHRDDWLRKQIGMSKGVIVPYDYIIIFDPKVCLFRFIPPRGA